MIDSELNKHLLSLIIRDRKTGSVSLELADILFRIITQYSKTSRFRNFDKLERLQTYSIDHLCTRQALAFDPAKSNNPLSYITTSIAGNFVYAFSKLVKTEQISKLFGMKYQFNLPTNIIKLPNYVIVKSPHSLSY